MTQIQDLQERIGAINEKSGFNQLKEVPKEYQAYYIGTKVMLMVTELAEGFEEVRAGHDPNETYYPAGPVPASLAVEFASGSDAQEYWEQKHAESLAPKKAEGLPSELADTVIRVLSLAYELGIDLDVVIEDKLLYNATRAYRHGKAF
jgi:NTP pyrophosphatase (non-canonical NTP hydrolase)